jgi:hypothetical protein
MFICKNCLTKQEKANLSILISELPDHFGEFYLTKEKLRLYVRENLDSLFRSLNKGDKILFGDKEQVVAVITGYAEKQIEILDYVTKEKKLVPTRKYVTMITKDESNARKMLEFIDYQLPKEILFCKLKKNNPILKIFYEGGYTFFGARGNEILVRRLPIKVPYIPFKDFEEN